MPIASEHELLLAIRATGTLLQAIEDYAALDPTPATQVPPPEGILAAPGQSWAPAGETRDARDARDARHAAELMATLEVADLQRWLLVRFTLSPGAWLVAWQTAARLYLRAGQLVLELALGPARGDAAGAPAGAPGASPTSASPVPTWTLSAAGVDACLTLQRDLERLQLLTDHGATTGAAALAAATAADGGRGTDPRRGELPDRQRLAVLEQVAGRIASVIRARELAVARLDEERRTARAAS